MKLFEKIASWFKKKPSLRERCIEAYGPEFGEIYDNLNSGIPVGGFVETAAYLHMISEVQSGKAVMLKKDSDKEI